MADWEILHSASLSTLYAHSSKLINGMNCLIRFYFRMCILCSIRQTILDVYLSEVCLFKLQTSSPAVLLTVCRASANCFIDEFTLAHHIS